LKRLTVEGQSGVGRDAGQLLLAIGHVRGDNDSALTTNLHTYQTDIPALDDLTLTQTEGERLSLGVGVKDLAVVEFSNVSHSQLGAVLCDGTCTSFLILDSDTLNNPLGGGCLLGLLGLFRGLLGVLLAVSWALLDRLCKLDLLLGLGGFRLGGFDCLSTVSFELL
jgi:hypothetical protein